VFILRYWAGFVKDSDNTRGPVGYGGIDKCIPKCSWKTWGKKSHDRPRSGCLHNTKINLLAPEFYI
jgi:hypothetical protein